MRKPMWFRRLTAAVLPLAVFVLAPRVAHAQRAGFDQLSSRGTLVIDQLAGFRASTIGGVGYASPIGFSTQNESVDITDNQGRVSGTDSIHFTNFWIAPSADYFVIDHLSVGGVIEFATTSQTDTVTLNGPPTTVTTTTNRPTLTNFTFLPRVGWMFDITDRFSIWPRGGLGYASRQTASLNPLANANATDTYSAFIFDVDCGFLYRITDTWFIKGAPEITFGPGSVSHTDQNNGTTVTTSNGASFFQFAVVGGVGVSWNLL